MDNSIIIRKMNKYYGRKQALFDIDLTIEQGMFGLLGRNGAGKTTLMKTLAALHKKKDGKITVCGVPIEKEREIRAMIGYLPQDFSMYPNMRTDEALDYLGALSGIPKDVRKKRVNSLLRKVNLQEHRRKKPAVRFLFSPENEHRCRRQGAHKVLGTLEVFFIRAVGPVFFLFRLHFSPDGQCICPAVKTCFYKNAR